MVMNRDACLPDGMRQPAEVCLSAVWAVLAGHAALVGLTVIGVNVRAVTAKVSPRTVRLRATELGQFSVEHAARLCGPEAAAWLGPPVGQSPTGMQRFATDLRLGPHEGGLLATFHKAAYVDLGPGQRDGDGLRFEISWRSATLAPLFPVFSGWLTVRPGELVLDGHYAPPGGAIGLLADRALLHLAARRTARSLLIQLREAAGASPAQSRVPADSQKP